eukprot:349738-Chlamydomonas_euryale.AAC.9
MAEACICSLAPNEEPTLCTVAQKNPTDPSLRVHPYSRTLCPCMQERPLHGTRRYDGCGADDEAAH